MTHETVAGADVTEPSASDLLAGIISWVINPLVLPVISVGLVAYWGGGSGSEVAQVAFLGSVFFALIPGGIVWLLLRMGRVDSLDIRVRQNRIVPFIAGVASFAGGVLALGGVDTPATTLIVALTLCLIVNAVVMTLITLSWKISVHGAGIGGVVGLLLFLKLVPMLPSMYPSGSLDIALGLALVAVPAVIWARVHLGAHTPGQAIAGALTGIILPLVELYYLWSLGILLPI